MCRDGPILQALPMFGKISIKNFCYFINYELSSWVHVLYLNLLRIIRFNLINKNYHNNLTNYNFLINLNFFNY